MLISVMTILQWFLILISVVGLTYLIDWTVGRKLPLSVAFLAGVLFVHNLVFYVWTIIKHFPLAVTDATVWSSLLRVHASLVLFAILYYHVKKRGIKVE